MSTRGEHLVRADRRFSTGGLALLKPLAPAFRVVLDRIDAGLLSGGIDATLPDGSRRRLGFRTDGPVAIVRLNSWRAMLRLATSGSVGWYNAWLKGEWQSPDPVPLFDLFMQLMGLVSLGWMWLKMAGVSDRLKDDSGEDRSFHETKIATARFYAQRELVTASALRKKVEAGAESVMALPIEAF